MWVCVFLIAATHRDTFNPDFSLPLLFFIQFTRLRVAELWGVVESGSTKRPSSILLRLSSPSISDQESPTAEEQNEQSTSSQEI